MLKATALYILVACLLILSGCFEDTTPVKSEVSERPGGELAPVTLQAGQSNIGLRLRVSYQDLEAVLASEVPEVQEGTGRKRVCKRVIGIKICGTANWVYTATRTDEISVTGEFDQVRFLVPIRFDGTAGVDGDAAKRLGLNDVDFQGAVAADIGMTLDLDDQWCPVITTDIKYRWTESPKVRWAGGIDIGIQSRLDETIDDQLKDIDERIKESIDCEVFRQQLGEQWRPRSFPIELPSSEAEESAAEEYVQADLDTEVKDPVASRSKAGFLYLNLRPQSMQFSGVKTETDRLGVSFVLVSETTVDAEPVADKPIELPVLQRTDYAVGQTSFELPISLPYEVLERFAREEVVGRTFTNNESAADLAVTVTDVEFYASDRGLTIGLTFDADLPATIRNTIGRLYLTTVPVLDTFNRTLTLSETSLSPVLDSALWQVLTTIFENQIIRAIEEKTVLELGEHLDDLERKVAAQLSSPARTGGLLVSAEQPRIHLTDIVPQTDALVLRVEFSTELDIDVPADLIDKRP